MDMLIFSPLKLGILLRLVSGVALMQSTLPSPSGDLGSPQVYLDSMRHSPRLQAYLDATVDELMTYDPRLARSEFTVAVIDLNAPGGPRMAHVRGDLPLYPASVIKFVYLMAAFRWQEEGRLILDKDTRRQLKLMIHDSSNQATQWVFSRLTGTQPGPALSAADYPAYRDRRYVVKRWVQDFGISDLHCVGPTYDSRGEIFGREAQFLSDRSIRDGGQGRGGYWYNRVMMTALGTARLLALLAADRAMSPESCGAIREMMRRDLRTQPYLWARIAGGADRLPGMEVFSKSGTALNAYADAGIVRHVSGRQMVVAVFTESPWSSGYRGPFIADLTERMGQRLLLEGMDYTNEMPSASLFEFAQPLGLFDFLPAATGVLGRE